MTVFVVDTNVPLTANGSADQASDTCKLACIERLRAIVRGGIVAIDQLGLILAEYGKLLRHAGQPGVGDAFFKHVWDNQANVRFCEVVTISPIDGKVPTFKEFPNDDAELSSFDSDDRKFVAVVRASQSGPVVQNASDNDWWVSRGALARNGVRVEFLCPELMNKGPRRSAKPKRRAKAQ